jgi:mannosyltransferase OCH1-like enzyme
MIPKIIHYSWISNDPYPEKIQKCIDSWKEKLPDYQFINWNRDTFDFDSVQWLREAYEDKNWAYCADFLRIQALYHYGGIWLDTDVEVIKSFNDLLDLPYFLGVEPFFGEKKFNELGIEAAVMGTEKHSPIFSCVLNWYYVHTYYEIKDNLLEYILPNIMKRCISYLYNNLNYNMIIDKQQFININSVINIFTYTVFSALIKTIDGELLSIEQDENTYTIHHFNGGWVTEEFKNKFFELMHN